MFVSSTIHFPLKSRSLAKPFNSHLENKQLNTESVLVCLFQTERGTKDVL